jgi:hypothetical protein
MPLQVVDVESVKRRLRFDYLGARSDPTSRVLDGYVSLLAHFQKQPLVVRELIQDTANWIHRQFRLRWCMIGLRGPDGVYRYEVEAGMRPDAWTKQKAKMYKYTDFAPSAQNYTAGEISKLSRVYLEEENELYKEDEGVVNRPALLRARRKADDETLEADFIDTLIMGPRDDLLGWIEYSGTLTGKFPDPMTVRFIEAISAIIAAAITSQSGKY